MQTVPEHQFSTPKMDELSTVSHVVLRFFLRLWYAVTDFAASIVISFPKVNTEFCFGLRMCHILGI